MGSIGELYWAWWWRYGVCWPAELLWTYQQIPFPNELVHAIAKPSWVRCSRTFYSVFKKCGCFKTTHFSNSLCSAMIFEVLTVVLIEIILVDMKPGKSLSTFFRNILPPSSNRKLVHHLQSYSVSHLRRPQISYTICSDCLVSGLCLSSGIENNEELSVPGSIYTLRWKDGDAVIG